MSQYKVVAVKDIAVGVFGQPTFCSALGQAVRSFGDEVRRPHAEERPSPFNQHPEDYELWQLGAYDDETGLFTQDTGPTRIARGADYKE